MGKQDRTPLRADQEAKGELPSPSPSREIEPQVQPAEPATPLEWSVESLHLDFARAARTRRRSFLIRVLVFIGLPTLLSAAYVYLYATPRYVSEVQVVYQSSSPNQSQTGGALSSFLGSSSSGLDMQRVIGSYITSDTLLRGLDQQLNLRAHYSNPKIDWLDRLPKDATEEDFLDYFKKRVTVDVMIGGYDVIDVEAFDPRMASSLAQAMANNIDAMVESLTARQRAVEMSAASNELELAKSELVAAKLKTTEFRNAHRQFDPLATATQLESTVIGGLEGQLAQARATMASRQKILSPDSPTLKALQAQINALEGQIVAERLRLATTGAGANVDANGKAAPYSDLVAQFTMLTQYESFAADAYSSAKQAYDAARADAQRKENFVEAFVKPNMPQKSTSPNPLVTILATFLISFVVYMGVTLVIAALRDQGGM